MSEGEAASRAEAQSAQARRTEVRRTKVRKQIAPELLAWYDKHARRLPWRDEPTPYRVWISEIMLQQTRVETVIPYFERWMGRFPTLKDLAAASEQEVLQAWEGLGYYSRARNLHKAARQVMADHAGQIPSTREELERLPGIGPYTAGAIASIAFGKDEPALDANIRRVLARVFNVDVPARSPEGERRLWQLASETLPTDPAGGDSGRSGGSGRCASSRSGDYNQAMMDLGASICTPHAPTCLLCPLAGLCEAHALGIEEQRPVLEARPAVPHYLVTAAVIERGGQVFIARRPSSGLLGGLWEFPGGKVEAGESLPEGLRREIMEELGVAIEVGEQFGVYHHAYTHFKVTLHAFLCQIVEGEPQALHASEIRWASPGELNEYPMGKIDRQIARLVSETNRKAKPT